MVLNSFGDKILRDSLDAYKEVLLSSDDAGDNSWATMLMQEIDKLDAKFSYNLYKEIHKDPRALQPLKYWALVGIWRIIKELNEGDSLESGYICCNLEFWLARNLA